MTPKHVTVADVLAGDAWMFAEDEFEDPEAEPDFPWWARRLPPDWWSDR